MIEPTGLEWLDVKSTLPSVPYSQDTHEVRTQRLLLRKFRIDDLEPLFELRSHPDVAAWTPSGKPETDIEQTKKVLAAWIDGQNDKNLKFAICLASTGEFIGQGGVHSRQGQLGWPELGYAIRKEHWGKGYATEFVKAFLDLWWRLPRVESNFRVDARTLSPGCEDGQVANECIVAITVDENKGSRGVLVKSGMELTKIWRVEDMRDETQMVDLLCYVMTGRKS
ncbi:GCN5-related N-acetyltransferase (GNAT) domain-containing protein [Pochonia chlamydosporia 170]|uniref:GCN5-related N-acetyltransferase (GNAT) domain-containing protein n=1 Tax=Pochonia chlamydosporia 170 TaxID=1380566 RepID=A0A179FJK1_METCM|nr:GCN5-related N-acetyltransferase (GNAT) domain-containing protein [Pochonia chlamydosporia 170]OAQ65488.1 GCN5-related N-acetyltransferase (GNAT) domain-containing protein [Pochonia chlamydosporia 170]